MSSASSADGGGGGARTTVEDDLHIKLQTLQDMFTSTRPVSVLYLRGDEHDDPDAHPVSLSGDSQETRAENAREGSARQGRSGHSSNAASIVSPSPSSLSLASQASAIGPGGHWQNFDAAASGEASRKGTDQPTRIQKTGDEGTQGGWIEAVGVDQTYRPPPQRTPKPVACFYVLRRANADDAPQQQYYHAIYLLQRSLKDLNGRIAKKFGLDPSEIVRTIHTTQNGLEVEMDDDVVQNLKEGQDMMLQVQSVETPVKREWEMAVDAETDEAAEQSSGGLVLRLSF